MLCDLDLSILFLCLFVSLCLLGARYNADDFSDGSDLSNCLTVNCCELKHIPGH